MKKITLFIFLLPIILFSQNPSFTFTNKQNQTILPFEIVNNLIIIKIAINNYPDSMRFIFDTGIKPTLITNFSENLTFQVTDKVMIRGLGNGEDIQVLISPNNSMSINDELTINNQVFYIFPYDKFELSKQLGMTINGIIGFALFEKFIVQVDYEAKKIILFNPEKFKKHKRYKNWERIPIKIYNGKPYMQIEVFVNDTLDLKSNVLIDLGASDALWLFPQTFSNYKSIYPPTLYYLGQGLNGDIFGFQTSIKKLKLTNKYFFDNLATSIPDTFSIKVPKDYDVEGRNGTIGAELLRRFHVLLDYQKGFMYIKKNKFYNDVFNYDLSGIEIQAPYPGVKYYTIYYIHPNSPASSSGLQIGDILLNIDNQSVNELKLNEILLILSTREGKTIRITVQRQEEIITTKLKLFNYKLFNK